MEWGFAIICLLFASYCMLAPSSGVVAQAGQVRRLLRAMRSSRLAVGERVVLEGVLHCEKPPSGTVSAPQVFESQVLEIQQAVEGTIVAIGTHRNETVASCYLEHATVRIPVDLHNAAVKKEEDQDAKLDAAGALKFAPELVSQHRGNEELTYKLTKTVLMDGDTVIVSGQVAESASGAGGQLVLKGTAEIPISIFAGSLEKFRSEAIQWLCTAALSCCAIGLAGAALVFKKSILLILAMRGA